MDIEEFHVHDRLGKDRGGRTGCADKGMFSRCPQSDVINGLDGAAHPVDSRCNSAIHGGRGVLTPGIRLEINYDLISGNCGNHHGKAISKDGKLNKRYTHRLSPKIGCHADDFTRIAVSSVDGRKTMSWGG
ncbi:MAG: hypothetical protein ACNA7E_07710 [Wenzhouxiangellaceae bacterium]